MTLSEPNHSLPKKVLKVCLQDIEAVFLFDLKNVRNTKWIENRYIAMYQTEQGSTLDHLVPTVAGAYNSTVLDMKQNETNINR